MSAAMRGFLVFVPMENVASWEAEQGGNPERVTVATIPGNLAGPFEVREHVRITLPPHQPGCPALLNPLGDCTCEPPERYGYDDAPEGETDGT